MNSEPRTEENNYGFPRDSYLVSRTRGGICVFTVPLKHSNLTTLDAIAWVAQMSSGIFIVGGLKWKVPFEFNTQAEALDYIYARVMLG